MITLLADANLLKHVNLLVARMRAEPWKEFWDALDLRCVTFADVGLDLSDSDTVVWQSCQRLKMLLITDNRNSRGPDSLEAAIRSLNTPDSLPVFTIGDSQRVLSSPEYAEAVVDRLFRYLLELENIRGTGRLYLP